MVHHWSRRVRHWLRSVVSGWHRVSTDLGYGTQRKGQLRLCTRQRTGCSTGVYELDFTPPVRRLVKYWLSFVVGFLLKKGGKTEALGNETLYKSEYRRLFYRSTLAHQSSPTNHHVGRSPRGRKGNEKGRRTILLRIMLSTYN